MIIIRDKGDGVFKGGGEGYSVLCFVVFLLKKTWSVENVLFVLLVMIRRRVDTVKYMCDVGGGDGDDSGNNDMQLYLGS